MSERDEDMKKTIVIYHDKCADGFTSAWAAWRHFGESADYYGATHGNPPPDVVGREVIIVDFSYRRAVLDEMTAVAESVIVLDHHKTAQEDLKGLIDAPRDYREWRLGRAALGGLGCAALFDMERSGAGITWDFFHPGEGRPALVNYVEDRDLWRFDLPHSREVNAYIFAHEYSFPSWENLAADLCNVDRAADMGAAIEKKHHKDVRELVQTTWRKMVIGGQLVPVANIPYTLTSDAGHFMCQGLDEGLLGAWIPPFAACYWDTPEGRVFSLRSDGRTDVSEVAKGYGGGGHAKASGFRMPIGWEGDAA